MRVLEHSFIDELHVLGEVEVRANKNTGEVETKKQFVSKLEKCDIDERTSIQGTRAAKDTEQYASTAAICPIPSKEVSKEEILEKNFSLLPPCGVHRIRSMRKW